MQARGVRAIRRVRSRFPRGQDTQHPETQNPPRKAGLHIPVNRETLSGIESFPEIAGAFKREFRATGKVRPACAAPGGLL